MDHAYIVCGPYERISDFDLDTVRDKPIWKLGFTSGPPSPYGRSGLKSEGLIGLAWLKASYGLEQVAHQLLDDLKFEKSFFGSTERRKSHPKLFDWTDALILHGIATSNHQKLEQMPEFDWNLWRIDNQNLYDLPRRQNGQRTLWKDDVDKRMTPGDMYGATKELLDTVIRPCLGGFIGFDPCTSYEHQQRVKAKIWLTKDQNSLSPLWSWSDGVWMFPPYFKGLHGGRSFAERFIKEFDAGNITTAIVCYHLGHQSNDWWVDLAERADAFYIPRQRINFIPELGVVKKENGKGSATDGNIFLSFGIEQREFFTRFSKFGAGSHDKGFGHPIDGKFLRLLRLNKSAHKAD